MEQIWFFLIIILFIGYSLLDGFDLGIGALFPFLAKTESEKKALLSAIGPVWDGNEVWLITAGAAIFAAFPQAYATIFSGFYIPLMLVLFALIFRAVSIEFWHQDEKRRGLWQWTFILGSLLPALLFGVALGNVMVGIPMDQNFEFTGSFWGLLNPFSLSCGVLGLITIMLQGTTFTAIKTDGQMQGRARKLAKNLWIGLVIMLIVTFTLGAINQTGIPDALSKAGTWIFTGIILLALALGIISIRKQKDIAAFIANSLVFIGLWGIAAFANYPYIISAAPGGTAMTLSDAASSEKTLKVMLIIAAVGMPIVIGYTIYVYRVFKGKVQ